MPSPDDRTSPSGEVVAAAQAAIEATRWEAAYEALAEWSADSQDPMVLLLFAEAAFWLGRFPEAIHATERAFGCLERAGRRLEAGELAAQLCDMYAFTGRAAVSRGWLARAITLVDDTSESRALALVRLRQTEAAHREGDLEVAESRARESLEVARRLQARDVEAEALQAVGRVLIDRGDPAAGMMLLDEAMLVVSSGEIAPRVTGRVYCSMVGACRQLGDDERATEWTEVTSVWASHHPRAVYPGICRTYRAELLYRRGLWDQAEQEALQAAGELRAMGPAPAAQALQSAAEVRLRRGDLMAAERLLADAEQLGASGQPVRALLHLAAGNTSAALAGIKSAVASSAHDRLSAARLLTAAVEIGIAAGDHQYASSCADDLGVVADDYPTAGLRAAATTARGRVLLARGDLAEAAATLRDALQQWLALSVPYEAARIQALLAEVTDLIGDHSAAASLKTAAHDTLARLGALPRRSGLAQIPAGLTQREAEVLGLVAAGLTNREVGEALHLSHKTVARHLSNIFAKTGLTSRVAATAFAIEHGLTRSGLDQ